MAAVAAWQAIGVWIFCATALTGIVARPWRIAEWVWTVVAAVGVVTIGAVPFAAAAGAVANGTDVYAFLIGILLLAEIGRRERVFDAFAAQLLRLAAGSRARLLALVYGLGIVVTALLSNDATVIVLTPAVLAAIARTDADPLPYAYACAFVANAASFILPISNPANLVVFGNRLPPVLPWLGAFGASAAGAVAVTFLVLRLATNASLRDPLHGRSPAAPPEARFGAIVLGIAGLLLVVAALMGADIGYAALACGAGAFALTYSRDRGARTIVRHLSWQIVPLVAGLFVLVAALERVGALAALRQALVAADRIGPPAAALAVSAAVTTAANVANNLPVALATGAVLQNAHVSDAVTRSALVAVDLGPKLSVTGSLATFLWLFALRREGVEVTPLAFLKLGAFVTIPALVCAVLLVR